MATVTVSLCLSANLNARYSRCVKNKDDSTLPIQKLLLSKQNGAKIFENNLNLVMLVFIGKLLLSTVR